jgi:pimeloyl-ACP methyl ester carboxylesterase
VTQLSSSLDLPQGRRIAYEVIGKGQPLLWMEGGPAFHPVWAAPMWNCCRTVFSCYLVDAPGCGRSSPATRENDYDHLGPRPSASRTSSKKRTWP